MFKTTILHLKPFFRRVHAGRIKTRIVSQLQKWVNLWVTHSKLWVTHFALVLEEYGSEICVGVKFWITSTGSRSRWRSLRVWILKGNIKWLEVRLLFSRSRSRDWKVEKRVLNGCCVDVGPAERDGRCPWDEMGSISRVSLGWNWCRNWRW